MLVSMLARMRVSVLARMRVSMLARMRVSVLASDHDNGHTWFELCSWLAHARESRVYEMYWVPMTTRDE